ncbi:MAG: hypothetical protein WCC27_16775, partial [Acidobacteriaceae bacterium]
MTGSPWHRRLSASALALCGFLAAPLIAQNSATPQPPPATDQSTPAAPTPTTTPAPATPTIAQQAQQIQLQSIGPQQPFHVEMPKSHFNPLFPYRPSKAPELDLHNSPRLENLIRDGKLYISIQDAIALALENNLDIAYARYYAPLAQTDILRTKSGSPAQGVNASVTQSTQG